MTARRRPEGATRLVLWASLIVLGAVFLLIYRYLRGGGVPAVGSLH
jgi:hypothetical protein